MIDEMVALLGEEQKSDDDKKAYCLKALDKDEVEALEDAIKQLDKDVVEATETREQENKLYVKTMAEDNAAKDLIALAKNRLAKFYTPKLYKAPPKVELTAEERITVSMGGTLEATAAPGGIAGT